MRLFHIFMTVIFAYAHHQLGVRIATFRGKEVEQCLSKEAYFHTENNYLTILSISAECNKQLMDVVQYAKTIPEDLRVHVINAAEDYEGILQRPYELCEANIADDVNEETVKWLLIDCNEGKRKNNTISRIKWLIISIITAITITVVITIGTCSYFIKKKKQIKQKQQEQEQQQQHQQLQQQSQQTKTSSGKLNEMASRAAPANTPTTCMQTREKVGMKRNELEEIDERTSRQADEEFQQEKKDLIAFYKQVRQCFPEKTENTQQQSEKKQVSEEDDSSSSNSSKS